MSANLLKIAAPLWRAYCREHRDQMVWIYAFQVGDDGPIKIGISRTPDVRLRTLQQANPHQLRPRAAWRGFSFEEKQIHDEFAHARMAGEWFHPVPELVELVDAYGDSCWEWER